MGNHLLDGGEESKNFENFQEYPSFDNGILDLEPIIPETVNSGIPETSNNYEKAIVPGTIDSRSFTHTEAEWQRIQAGEPTVNYVDATDSWDNYREDKPQSFFRTLLAFFVSIIVAGIFVLINVKFYDIGHISTLQCMLSMLSPLMMFCSFYFITGKKELMVVEGLLLIVLNEIISYIMFRAVMVHNVQKIYPEFSSQEAWKFVEVMKTFPETQRIYYLHFVIIFGIASLLGIAIGSTAFKGLFGRRRRY